MLSVKPLLICGRTSGKECIIFGLWKCTLESTGSRSVLVDMFCGIDYETSGHMEGRVTIWNRSVLHEAIQDNCTILLTSRLSTDTHVCVCVCFADVFEWLFALQNCPNPWDISYPLELFSWSVSSMVTDTMSPLHSQLPVSFCFANSWRNIYCCDVVMADFVFLLL
jgi:hypothetical protein